MIEGRSWFAERGTFQELFDTFRGTYLSSRTKDHLSAKRRVKVEEAWAEGLQVTNMKGKRAPRWNLSLEKQNPISFDWIL